MTDHRPGIAVLGSTGSVGTQTLDVVRAHPDRFRVVALAAGQNVPLLLEQAHEFRPDLISCQGPAPADCPAGVACVTGDSGLLACVEQDGVDIVVVASAGIASLPAVFAAARRGMIIALANKESLVCAAPLLLPLVEQHGAEIRPVDSEHSAIWQCTGVLQRPDVRKLTLTASGGPFRHLSPTELARVTAADALKHPTWSMGSKITIDSATLVNKGLEVIEAHYLFGIDYSAIDVVVHPESIVHSFVEFMDGSTLAQLSNPDMRLPIQYALTAPEHAPLQTDALDLTGLARLTFESVRREVFPGLDLCISVGRAGLTSSIALCAADEIAVAAFLDYRLSYPGITDTIQHTLETIRTPEPASIEEIVAITHEAERIAAAYVAAPVR